MGLEYKYVRSSNMRGVRYDAKTSTMYVQFNNGSEYAYSDVPVEEYESLLEAPSPGSYLNDFIKGTYRHSKV